MIRRIAAAGLLVALLGAGTPAAGQVWDTHLLVRDAGVLTEADLPRLRERATGGEPRAQVLLGLAHEMGVAGLTPDPVQALALFIKAADQGIVWAQVWAGDFYYTGSPGVPKDLYKAMTLYQSAAAAGDGRAAFLVGQMFFFGDGPVANHREAAQWLRRATAAEPQLAARMLTLAEASCDSAACVSLRQLVGAFASDSAERYLGAWDDSAGEWEAVQALPHSDRCGFTSADHADDGEIQHYFCDSQRMDDPAAGRAAARRLADDVTEALPRGWSRTDPRPGEAVVHLFSRQGFPRIQVAYDDVSMPWPRVTVTIGR